MASIIIITKVENGYLLAVPGELGTATRSRVAIDQKDALIQAATLLSEEEPKPEQRVVEQGN